MEKEKGERKKKKEVRSRESLNIFKNMVPK